MDLVRKPPVAATAGWYLSLSNGIAVAGYFRSASASVFGAATNSVADGNWHHVAFTVDSGSLRVYVDGSFQASSPWVGAPGPIADVAEMRLGGPAPFNGELDEVSVWNSPLDPDQVLFLMSHSQVGTEGGLVAYYRCDETGGTQLSDSAPASGSNSGILLNGPTFVPSGIAPFSPGVTTLPANLLTSYGATLNGSTQPAGAAVNVAFQWGTTTNYGNVTPWQSAAAPATNFSQRILGLGSNTYHFRAVGSNSLGQAFGDDVAFAITNGPTVTSGTVGSGQSFDSRQPSLELHFIICTNGVFAGPGDQGSPPLLGEVRLYAGRWVPVGWTLCNGQLLNVNDHFALFYIIGTTYGGNGTNNFALPDFRSRTIAALGQGPGLSAINAGEIIGTSQITLPSNTIPAHTHPLDLPYFATGPAGLTFPRPNRNRTLGLNCLIMLQGTYPTSAQTIFEPFIGQMPMYAPSYGLGNAVACQGQTLAINQNSAMFTIIGTNFGGNGVTTFALPDLRGRTPMGTGQGTGLSPRALGERSGAESVTMTVGQLPSHRHTVPAVAPMPGISGFAGSNQPQNVIQPSLGIRFLISTNGELPSSPVQPTNKFLGEIQLFAGTNMPEGWAPCEGQLLSVSAYPQLFGVISNDFGGDGVTTFALPNLSGRIPVGVSNGIPGVVYGNEGIAITEAQMPAHTHPVPILDFQAWCDVFGLSGAAAAFDSDPDSDGAKNGFEWVVGTDPTNAASFSPLAIAAAAGQAKLRFSRNTNATDVSLQLQRTANLGDSNSWSGLVTNVAGVWSLPGIVSETGAGNPKSVQVSEPLTNAASDYRLKITRF